MGRHIGGLLDGGVRGEIILRCVKAKFVVRQLSRMQPSFAGLCQADRDIGFAPGETELAGHGNQFDRQVRMPVAELTQAWCQKFGAETVRGADPYGSVGLKLRVADGLGCRRGELVHLFCHFQQSLARFGQGRAAGAAIEQLRSQRGFECCNSPAESGIVDFEPFCGSRHAAAPRDGKK